MAELRKISWHAARAKLGPPYSVVFLDTCADLQLCGHLVDTIVRILSLVFAVV